MRKIIIEIETDSERRIGTLKQDLEQEISCCWNSFDVDKMKVSEALVYYATGATTTRESLGLKETETMCEKCTHEEICRREQCGEPYCVIRSCFDFEAKRPRGEWLEVGYSEDYRDAKYKCSKCKTEYKYTDFINIEPIECFPKYCPNCGSDNRKKGET